MERTKKERFDFRVQALGTLPDGIDLHVFQDVPTLIQKEILTGNLLYTDNYEFMIAECMNTIRYYDRFVRHYDRYMKQLEAEI